MLTKGDKEAIREIVRALLREELKAALCRKILIERGPRQQGDPEKVVKEEEWNVLDFMAIYMPKIEGALRGMQEDVDHAKNTAATTEAKIETIGAILLNMEQAAKMLASASDRFRLLKPEDVLKLASGG